MLLEDPRACRDELQATCAIARRRRAPARPCAGRILAMYFEKPSLRTHVTFEAGMTQLGGHAILLRPEQVGIGTRASRRRTSRATCRAGSTASWRAPSATRSSRSWRAHATIPVINGLTDLLHPCQAMADLQTIAERVELEKAVIAYVGDGNNVANSLLNAAAVLGLRAAPRDAREPPAGARVMRRRARARSRRERRARSRFIEDPGRGRARARTSSTPTSGPAWARKQEAAERRKLSPALPGERARCSRTRPTPA